MPEPKKLKLPHFDPGELLKKWLEERGRKKDEQMKRLIGKVWYVVGPGFVVNELNAGPPLAPVLNKVKEQIVNSPSVEKILNDAVREGSEKAQAERDRKEFEDLRERRERSTDPAEQKRLEKEMLVRVLEGRH